MEALITYSHNNLSSSSSSSSNNTSLDNTSSNVSVTSSNMPIGSEQSIPSLISHVPNPLFFNNYHHPVLPTLPTGLSSDNPYSLSSYQSNQMVDFFKLFSNTTMPTGLTSSASPSSNAFSSNVPNSILSPTALVNPDDQGNNFYNAMSASLVGRLASMLIFQYLFKIKV